MKSRKLPGPRRLKVNSRRNSECTSAPLAALDWSNWWTDGGPNSFSRGAIYLHVKRLDRPGDPADGRSHRVFCRASEGARSVRLRMLDGELFWLVDGSAFPTREAVRA